MEKNKYYPVFKNGTDFTSEYDSIFALPTTEEEMQTTYYSIFPDAIEEYVLFQDQAIEKLKEFIEEEKITLYIMQKSPYSSEAMFIKEIIPTLGLIQNTTLIRLMEGIGLKGTTTFLLDIYKIREELIELSNSYGFPQGLQFAIVALISKMVYLKLRSQIEEDYGFIKREKNGTITETKDSLNKALRQMRENKPKTEYDDETEAFVYSEEGKHATEVGRKLLSKNQSQGYNMTFLIQPIFQTIVDSSKMIELKKAQQYRAIYSLFREIYPERNLYKNSEEHTVAHKPAYDDFEEYQEGTIKTILGITR